jgi:hypothetical protein
MFGVVGVFAVGAMGEHHFCWLMHFFLALPGWLLFAEPHIPIPDESRAFR